MRIRHRQRRVEGIDPRVGFDRERAREEAGIGDERVAGLVGQGEESGPECIRVTVLDGRVEKGSRGGPVAAFDGLAQGLPRSFTGSFGASERGSPSCQSLLTLRIDDRAHACTRLRVTRNVRERRRERLARPRHVENHGPQQGNECRCAGEGGQDASADERGTPVRGR
jgi:hypothetical protein